MATPERPSKGGSYSRDPKTGKLTLIEHTKEPVQTNQVAPPPPAKES